MLCPDCQKENRTSKVYSGSATSTLKAWTPYWDEKGTLHSHDPNYREQQYNCSNGHHWTTKSLPPCLNCSYPWRGKS